MIDGSGWGETFPGSGLYVHSNNVFDDGGCMWNGKPLSWLLFDLGKEYNVNGMYVWNYNEKGGWNTRGVKQVEVTSSSDGNSFSPAGTFTLKLAPGTEDYGGEVIPFTKPIRARYFKWQIKSNYRGGEMSGVAEVRFSNADAKAAPPVAADWTPKYPRPQHPSRIPSQQQPPDRLRGSSSAAAGPEFLFEVGTARRRVFGPGPCAGLCWGRTRNPLTSHPAPRPSPRPWPTSELPSRQGSPCPVRPSAVHTGRQSSPCRGLSPGLRWRSVAGPGPGGETCSSAWSILTSPADGRRRSTGRDERLSHSSAG
jgi:hypothetical protein